MKSVNTTIAGLHLSDMNYSGVTAELEKYAMRGLAETNRLTENENRELFNTGSVDAAVYLTMKGLSAIHT